MPTPESVDRLHTWEIERVRLLMINYDLTRSAEEAKASLKTCQSQLDMLGHHLAGAESTAHGMRLERDNKHTALRQAFDELWEPYVTDENRVRAARRTLYLALK